ncbi:MAG: ZIP family metal transporter [Candidatus Lokiarchaeota archaeon]|nr:ZIP family metal transporter [Candidatus Lokiarchaeota archaeon]
MVFIYILLSTIIVSSIALIGIFTIGLNSSFLNKILFLLVSFSAGALLGGGLLHLLPEAVEEVGNLNIYLILISGFILFFLTEKVLDYHQCHNVEEEHICEFHAFKWLNLFGDAIHNFIDGLIIAAAFLTSINLGFITSIAVLFHEIPQEIGDFGVLVYGGFTKTKALLLNFITALIAIFGGIIGYLLISVIEPITPFLLSFAAGGFLYIAASDLLPSLKQKRSGKKIISIVVILILGIVLMWGLKLIFE